MTMKSIIFYLIILSFFDWGHADHPLYDLKQEGFEQYQDVYIKGQVVEKASYGERYLEDRFAIVNRVFSRYKRPFTVLDVGASQGYFSFRGAELYPKSVFVMLEGSNSAYPLISKQLSSICHLNNQLENCIWLDRPIIVDEIKKLSFCEHFDVILLLNILHWFPENWKTLLEASLRMSHITVVELPPWEETLTSEHKELRIQIHAYLSTLAKEVIQGVPRHTDPSYHTTYYIVENKSPYHLETTSLAHLPAQRMHEVEFDYATKRLHKKDFRSPLGQTSNWVSGINLITYLMFNGAFPLRSELIENIQVDFEHKDWMPNNMILTGKKLVLIDKNDPRNEPEGNGSCYPYSTRKKEALEKLLLETSNTSPEYVQKAFEDFCDEN